MAIPHTVRQGDSLWHLAHRYLGSGTRWPEIYDFHNKEAARFGQLSRLLPIKDENLIFVGQTIMMPLRHKYPQPGTGNRAEGGKSAVPLDLKVEYTIGRDTPPIYYIRPYLDHTIKSEMTGKIAIEMMSLDRYRHSFELLMSKDFIEAKQKLYNAYDPALRALTAKPEMVFESGRIKIEAPIAAEADAGPLNIEVQALAPNHLTGTLKPPMLSGTVEAGGRKYKFSAEIELKAELIRHQRPKGGPPAPVGVTEPQRKNDVAIEPTNSVDWQKIGKETKEIVAMVAWTIVGAVLMWHARTAAISNQTTTIMPLRHTIDRRKLDA